MHAMAQKRRNDVINMNTALINAFLDLIPVAFKQSYEQIRMENPNLVFREMFAWFVTKYGHTSAEDRAANCNAMALDWHPSQGFELLVARLFCGATFANLAKYPIPDDNIVDIGIRVLHRTGLFAEEYKAWITRGDNVNNLMSFATFGTFWETAVNIAAFTASTPASQHGYGMAAAKDDASTTSLTDAVNNFGVAYAATQESLRSSNATISAMQGQPQMLCNMIGNQPPPGMVQFNQPPGQSRRTRGQRGGGRGGGTPPDSGGGRDHGGRGYSGPPNQGGAAFPNGGGAYNGGGGTYNSGGAGYGVPPGSTQPPSPVKRFKNWNYCHTHGGNVDDNHTIATCARPGEQHQRAATRTNTMNGNMRGMHKTVCSPAPSAAAPRWRTRPPLLSIMPPPSPCPSAMVDCVSQLPPAAGVLDHMRWHISVPTISLPCSQALR